MVWPGDEARYAQAAGKHGGRVRFVPQAAAAGLRARRLLRARVHRRRPVSAPGGRSPLRERRVEALRATAGGTGGGRGMRRFGGAADARKPAAALRRRGRAARAGRPGALPRRDGDREADAHRSRAAPDGAGTARRLLPLLLRHARAHAGGDGAAGAQLAEAPDAPRFPRRWPSWRGASSTWRWRSRTGATISARATAC